MRAGVGRRSARKSGPRERPASSSGSRWAVPERQVTQVLPVRARRSARSRCSTFRDSTAVTPAADSCSRRHRVRSRTGRSTRENSWSSTAGSMGCARGRVSARRSRPAARSTSNSAHAVNERTADRWRFQVVAAAVPQAVAKTRATWSAVRAASGVCSPRARHRRRRVCRYERAVAGSSPSRARKSWACLLYTAASSSARRHRKARSAALRVRAAARSNSTRAWSCRPRRANRSPRTLGSRW